MNEQEFKKWLRGEYRPPVESSKDAQGGYLIPHFITADKPDWLSVFCRCLGRTLRNPRIYKLGTYQFDMHKALTERF